MFSRWQLLRIMLRVSSFHSCSLTFFAVTMNVYNCNTNDFWMIYIHTIFQQKRTSQAYRELNDDEKRKYTDAARVALEKCNIFNSNQHY